jgi:Uma2 family endonuclease
MSVAARKMTYADYAKIPEDGNRHEILEGDWYVTPAPNTDHQSIVLALGALLKNFASSTDAGRAFVAPTDVLLSNHDIVQPDVFFVAKDRASIIEQAFIRGAPDLVVEVLSPATASIDRGRKLALYERSGVREYWIVDAQARTIEVHDFGSPRRVMVHDDRRTVVSAAVPGLQVPVADLFI